MIPSKAHHGGHHNMRFYVVMTTVVVGGIFLLLLMNNGAGITSAFTADNVLSDFINDNAIQIEPNLKIIQDQGSSGVDFAQSKPFIESVSVIEPKNQIQEAVNTVTLSLSFNKIPKVNRQAKVKTMRIYFDNSDSKISLNEDLLELNNNEEVVLELEEYLGDFIFDDSGLSLNGNVKTISVNNIKLSSKTNLKLSFDNLEYNRLEVPSIELQDIEIPKGDGELILANRLTYTLHNEALAIFYFNGELNVINNEATNMSGLAKGISVSGEELMLSVR